MFAATFEDLPLFSDTPIVVEEKAWNPQARPEPARPTVDMFPEVLAGKLCGHLGTLSIRAVRRGYDAECDTCGVFGPVKRTAQLASDALILGAKGPIVARQA